MQTRLHASARRGKAAVGREQLRNALSICRFLLLFALMRRVRPFTQTSHNTCAAILRLTCCTSFDASIERSASYRRYGANLPHPEDAKLLKADTADQRLADMATVRLWCEGSGNYGGGTRSA